MTSERKYIGTVHLPDAHGVVITYTTRSDKTIGYEGELVKRTEHADGRVTEERWPLKDWKA